MTSTIRRSRVAAAALAATVLALLGACGHDGSGATPPGPDNVVSVERGRYLAKAANCAACHTTSGGASFAGGVELKSSFGTFYGTNITPHKAYGIGNWSADDFYRAMHDGVTPAKHLYPAMPYTSYRWLTRADSDALYAYLMQINPAAVANREPDLKFPYNIRLGVRFWNMLFLKDEIRDASAGQSAQWLRGRYLGNALGHCAECHTPRGAMGQLNLARTLAGNRMGRLGAPDITPTGLAAMGWTQQDLASFLTIGVAPQGSAYGEMFEVVHLSTKHLVPNDMEALTTYLMGDKPRPAQPLKVAGAADAEIDAGRRSYVALCAGCHGLDGSGKPHVAVAMKGNTSVRNPDAHNLIAVTLDGIAARHFGDKESMQEMPGFAGKLTDRDVADLLTYMRASWGAAAGVSEAQVKAVREETSHRP